MKIFLVLSLLATTLIFSGCKDEEKISTPVPRPIKVLLSSPSDSSTVVNQGESFTRTVEVQGLEKAFYTAFDLSYDPSVIEYVDAADGPFLSDNGLDPISFQTTLQDGVQGKIVVGLTRLGRVDGVSGNGRLLTLNFRAIGPGTTTLAFASPKGIKNKTSQDVTIDSWENTTVVVQ